MSSIIFYVSANKVFIKKIINVNHVILSLDYNKKIVRYKFVVMVLKLLRNNVMIVIN